MTTTKEVGFMAEYTPVYLSKHHCILVLHLLEQYQSVMRGTNNDEGLFWISRTKLLIKNIKEAEGNYNE